MTTLYAWNTARAGSVAYPNVREARLFHPTWSRQFFGLCSIHLSPNKKIRPRYTFSGLLVLLSETAENTSNIGLSPGKSSTK
uniref:Uncharacterized protein n=1 Tax=Candidatus Kentrum sp. FM TaxID=2126340 RepID=A0A450WAG0_9GAMM|nr:MAG: hypothetical protein BECKFM1743C_GA0114222_102937 [Candidatus Kentron sp. FM]VFK14010.1 MAG: hypothetical protein BECKFM1743B_GA0114221_103016 [Candidatus Kentron sp. FM]